MFVERSTGLSFVLGQITCTSIFRCFDEAVLLSIVPIHYFLTIQLHDKKKLSQLQQNMKNTTV